MQETVGDLTPEELRELAEDALDDETERTLEILRRQRLAELQRQQQARFGRVYPISRDAYTQEVTEASKLNEEGNEEGNGTGVVCFLYKDGCVSYTPILHLLLLRIHRVFSIPRSDRAFEHVRVLARRHPDTKFVSIVGDKCIANLPDVRIPMFIIYRKGEVVNQIVAWGGDRERKIEGYFHALRPVVSDELIHEYRTGSRIDLSRGHRTSDASSSWAKPNNQLRRR